MNDIGYWIKLAELVATAAHSGQTRSDGSPYITHPCRVAANVEDRLKPIAWLHDVVEDTNVTLAQLRKMKFPEYIINAVDLLTHRREHTNVQYWTEIAKNADATAVKLVDIRDNLSDSPTEYQQKKYASALALFKQYGYELTESGVKHESAI